MTIIISGTVDIDPSRVEQAMGAAAELIDGARAEDGCLDYDWCPDPRRPGRLRVFERWRDESSLAAHFATRWYLDMRDLIGSFGLTGADVSKYDVAHQEPVYDDTGTPRADFFTRDAS